MKTTFVRWRRNWGVAVGCAFLIAGLFLFLFPVTGRSGSTSQRRISTPAANNPEFSATQGENLQRLLIGGSGDLFSQRLNGDIERGDPTGGLIWRIDPTDLSPGSPSFVTDISLGPNEDLLVVGLNSDPHPRMVVYRVARDGASPRIAQLGNAQEIEPASIAATADGGYYVAGLSAADFNETLFQLRHGKNLAVINVESPRLYRFDSEGRPVGSYLAFSKNIHSYEEVQELTDRSTETRLAVDPAGDLYLYERDRPLLYRFDPDNNSLSGPISIPYAGFGEAIVSDLQFVNRRSVVYSLFQIAKDRTVTGYQVRTLNLDTGTSRMLEGAAVDGTTRLAQAAFDRGRNCVVLYEPTSFRDIRRVALSEDGASGAEGRGVRR